jgi:hypothetical protein
VRVKRARFAAAGLILLANGDQNGLWLGAPSGVYLVRNGALGKVTSIAASPSGGCF